MRLPVDRVFTIAGAGTVVTGTMWSGSATRDDAVEIYPSGIRARVRGVHARVNGTAGDGRRYSASDPDLLTWVHAAEVSSFLSATRAYAPVRPAPAE